MRRRRQSVLSLLAFQDIITAVIGILLLVTLLLALELLIRPREFELTSAVSRPVGINERDELQNEVARLEQQVERAYDQLGAVSGSSLSVSDREGIALDRLDSLLRRRSRLSDEKTDLNHQIDSLRDELADIEARYQRLQARLDGLKTWSRELSELNPIVFNLEHSHPLTGWIIDVSGNEITISGIRSDSASTIFENSTTSGLPPSFRRFVKESGVDLSYAFTLRIKVEFQYPSEQRVHGTLDVLRDVRLSPLLRDSRRHGHEQPCRQAILEMFSVLFCLGFRITAVGAISPSQCAGECLWLNSTGDADRCTRNVNDPLARLAVDQHRGPTVHRQPVGGVGAAARLVAVE